jgi:hypothetical protein
VTFMPLQDIWQNTMFYTISSSIIFVSKIDQNRCNRIIEGVFNK